MFDAETLAQSSNVTVAQAKENFALVDCELENLDESIFYMKNHLGFAFLCGMNLDTEGELNRIYFWLENIERDFSLGVRTVYRRGAKPPSLAAIYKNAQCMEAELAHFGEVESSGSEYDLFDRQAKPYVKKKSVELAAVDENFHNYGWLKRPLNPFGEQKFSVVTKDDKVVKCEIVTGFYGGSIEKKLTSKKLPHLAWHLCKHDGYDGIVWCGMFYRALEEANNIVVPDKAQAVRMIFFELARILGHLEFVGQIAYQLKATSFYFKILKWVSQIERLQSLYSGNIYNVGVLTLGGIHRDPPPHWISTCLQKLTAAQSDLAAEAEKLVKNAFWRETAEIGVARADDLIEWGITGPDLRSAGINFDLRKRKPFYLYRELDFETPIGLNGSLFDRLLVRMQEVLQSMRIISQLLDNLPTGELVSKELDHFSHFKKMENEDIERRYRASVEKAPEMKNGLGFCAMETSRGVSTLFARTTGQRTENLYLGVNCFNRLLYLEKLAQGAPYENLDLLLKSFSVNLKTAEK